MLRVVGSLFHQPRLDLFLLQQPLSISRKQTQSCEVHPDAACTPQRLFLTHYCKWASAFFKPCKTGKSNRWQIWPICLKSLPITLSCFQNYFSMCFPWKSLEYSCLVGLLYFPFQFFFPNCNSEILRGFCHHVNIFIVDFEGRIIAQAKTCISCSILQRTINPFQWDPCLHQTCYFHFFLWTITMAFSLFFLLMLCVPKQWFIDNNPDHSLV